jgi:hypothetical protein
MELECPDGRHEHDHRGAQPRHPALYVYELLRPEIGAETGLREDVVRELERSFRRHNGVAAVRDVGEGAAVNEGGVALQGLHEVGFYGIFQEHGHGAVGAQISRSHRPLVPRVSDDDVS